MAKRVTKKKFSFVSPQGMGGIHGSKGYRFQDGYIVCRIANLVAQDNFLKLMPEGSGDVDIVYRKKGKQVYEHVQVKDHHVTNQEFKTVLQTFNDIDQGTEKIYEKFVLVAPTTSKEIKQLAHYIGRYKELKKLFDQNSKGLKSTESDINRVLKNLKLQRFNQFIYEKLDFEIGVSNFADNDTCKKLFISSLLQHPKYRDRLFEAVQPTFAVLIDTVSSHNGKTLHGKRLLSLIDSVLTNSKKVTRSTRLHVHNWTSEQFDGNPDFILDWSKYFQRDGRTVPEKEVWNEVLIPQLIKTKERILKKTSNRHVVFRGKCALTTGIALGCIFPEIGGWSFEIVQPPKDEVWTSGAASIEGYQVRSKEITLKGRTILNDNDLAFVFDITGKALGAVTTYLTENNLGIKKIIVIEPQSTPGTFSIKNKEEAISLAAASKDIMKQMIQKYNSKTAHLFFYGPLGLAIFLGQKLTSVGPIQLYEFQDPGYKPSGLIKT